MRDAKGFHEGVHKGQEKLVLSVRRAIKRLRILTTYSKFCGTDLVGCRFG